MADFETEPGSPYAESPIGAIVSDGSAAPSLYDSTNMNHRAGWMLGSRDPILDNEPPYGDDTTETVQPASNGPVISKYRAYAAVGVLVFINMLNYMDRFTVAGVLVQIKKYYTINDTQAGFLQTSFICSYMILAPVFGYLGDRYSRSIIMCCGILFWSATTLGGSFIPNDPPEMFWLFVTMRGLVGVGEASYSTIAPTIIADLFAKETRTRMLMFFFFATPIGSGLGYIVATQVASQLPWQWALRVTPGLGLVCVVLIYFLVPDVPRGMCEMKKGHYLVNTSVKADLTYLIHNKSFVLSSLGFTCVAFVIGALAYWSPFFMQYAIKVQDSSSDSEADVGLVFGIITCLAGFIGVGIGAESAKRLKKISPSADPLVCAFGMIMSTPFLYFALYLASSYTVATWVLVFLAETLLCLNWTLVADILLYVVIPTRRSTAEAFQILFSHLLGDAGSPTLVGLISDRVTDGSVDTFESRYRGIQAGLLTTTFVAVIGGAFFLWCSFSVEQDRQKADAVVKGLIEINEEPVNDDDYIEPEEHEISVTPTAVII